MVRTRCRARQFRPERRPLSRTVPEHCREANASRLCPLRRCWCRGSEPVLSAFRNDRLTPACGLSSRSKVVATIQRRNLCALATDERDSVAFTLGKSHATAGVVSKASRGATRRHFVLADPASFPQPNSGNRRRCRAMPNGRAGSSMEPPLITDRTWARALARISNSFDILFDI